MKTDKLTIRRRQAKPSISQAQLARHLGFARHTIIDIEAGRVGVDQATYERIDAAIEQLAATPRLASSGNPVDAAGC